MISGPVFPRTRAGLRELIERQLDSIERGMALVERDLELEPGCAIDVLARDAGGYPVFVFAVDAANERDIPSRVLATRTWMATGAPFLGSVLSQAKLDFDAAPRIVLMGFEVSPSLLQQLGDLRAEIEVYQIRSIRVGGRTLAGIVPLMGAVPLGREDSFSVPCGVSDPKAKTMCTRFIDMMCRIDAEIEVRGDRYSREFICAGETLAELVASRGAARVTVPWSEREAVEYELLSANDCEEAVDRVMRHYLAVLRRDRESAAAQVNHAEPTENDASEDDFVGSLDRLRDTVETTQITQEEYTVLGEAGPDID